MYIHYGIFTNESQPTLHHQLDRPKLAKQKIYDGQGNFHDGSVDSVALQLRRLRCSTLTTRLL